MKAIELATVSFLVFCGCNVEEEDVVEEDVADDTQEEEDTSVPEDTDTDVDHSFAVSGNTAVYGGWAAGYSGFSAGYIIGEVCATLVDPSPLDGGGAKELASTQIATDGTFQMTDVLTDATHTLLLRLHNCNTDSGNAYPTSTPISYSVYAGAGGGDTIDMVGEYYTDDLVATFHDEAVKAGYDGGDLGDIGFLMVWILNADGTGELIDNGSVDDGTDSLTVYYADALDEDMFLDPYGGVSQGTSWSAGWCVIPNTEMATYSFSSPGYITMEATIGGYAGETTWFAVALDKE